MELPRGSTPVYFAYAVHTDVGNTCIACRVNRRLAPLSQALESGATVEIISAPNRSEEHTSELQSRPHLVCRLLLEKKKKTSTNPFHQLPNRDQTHAKY